MSEKFASVSIDPNLLYLYNTGTYYHAYHTFGAHMAQAEDGTKGVRFTVWVPGARSVRVVGDYNCWMAEGFDLYPIGSTGVWSGFMPGMTTGMRYKYSIVTADGETLYKADPFAFQAELRPSTASVVADLSYEWRDEKWLAKRAATNHFETPKNIYEVHLGSWQQHMVETDDPGDPRKFYTYRELAKTLVPYVKKMGYTHVELLPLAEHPFDGSWGYQTTSYYAATSRYGEARDLKFLIDSFHRAGIGVIVDWVPGHFCRDSHGLGRFNGEMLYENVDHEQWGTYKFDFGRAEVRSFLLSNAMFWLEEYHVDGIRVDGVTSMLYLNFGVEDPGKQRQNRFGGDADLEAVSFLQEFARMVGQYFPGVFTAAEESTAWPLVTAPTDAGGLGFHYKWDMGWMNDTLKYMKQDFPYRSANHNLLTFSMMYAFNENFILPLSHDEVVHGKRSLIGRMPGDYWRQFAGLRLLALYQMTHPGGKLNFMGNEIGQFIEWRYYEPVEWFLLQYENHQKHQDFVRALNHVYKKEKALWSCDHNWQGFAWIDADNADQGILSYVRKTKTERAMDIVVINCGVMAYGSYRIGVPQPGLYQEIFNSDDPAYGGSGCVNPEPVRAEAVPFHGQPYSIEIKVPPIGGTIIKRVKK